MPRGEKVQARCTQYEKCGELADRCCHAKPHTPKFCGNCRTWCVHSNALCNGGECTSASVKVKDYELFKEKMGITFPIHCKEV